MISHYGFNLCLSDDSDVSISSNVEHLSMGHLYFLLGEVSIQVLCPFLNWVVCFPGVKSYEFFIYFGN